MSIQIHLNGEPHQLAGPVSVSELLEKLGLSHRRLAVEINRDIVPRSRHAEHQVQAGDQIELIQAMGGG